MVNCNSFQRWVSDLNQVVNGRQPLDDEELQIKKMWRTYQEIRLIEYFQKAGKPHFFSRIRGGVRGLRYE